MNVAEQTGAVLQNTSLSVNIKERLDFSCAIFDGHRSNLVANAPHVPVHLGAMGESVKHRPAQPRRHPPPRRRRRPQQPLQRRHPPARRHRHHPRLRRGRAQDIRFFVGSRGHHADIGGTTPGSTPPDSRTLEDEGVVLDDVLLVDAGRLPGSPLPRPARPAARHPARSPDVNVADIKAQVAANAARRAGAGPRCRPSIRLAHRAAPTCATSWTMPRKASAACWTASATGQLPLHHGRRRPAPRRRSRVEPRKPVPRCVDFTGTGPQSPGNFNAPPAVTRAVVLYVFRCLVGEDIPLNDGCLEPITLIIPPGTFLSPAPGAAVVAGNTEVSQAVCNALFGALGRLACSQATMNNVIFGDATRQYYETICGGMGAGPDGDGASAIQTHMTNTRMTDPEVFELRYPVILERFGIRRGSGGAGAGRGGDGSVRRIRFEQPMTLVVVASRREVAPFGLEGGADGASGRQWVERGGIVEPLSGRSRAELTPGDVFVIETPGGGGFG